MLCIEIHDDYVALLENGITREVATGAMMPVMLAEWGLEHWLNSGVTIFLPE